MRKTPVRGSLDPPLRPWTTLSSCGPSSRVAVVDRRISVYVDFDDVLCETARALLDFSRRAFHTTLNFEDIRSFDIAEAFGLSAEQAGRILRLIHDPDVLLHLDPVPGMVEGLRRWTASGFDVWIVTGRPPATWQASLNWLRRHGVPYTELIIVDKYGRNHPPHEGVVGIPLEELRRRSFALAVDDSPEVVTRLASQLTIPTILFERPWNRQWQPPPEAWSGWVLRCRGWPEVLDRVPDPPSLDRLLATLRPAPGQIEAPTVRS